MFIKVIHINLHIHVLILSFSYILNYFLTNGKKSRTVNINTLTELQDVVLDKMVCIPYDELSV